MYFLDRADAGRLLARELIRLRDARDLIVLALPRGGVPVGYEIARELHAPLDVFVVRKLGVPGREELAMGALASGGVRVLNSDVVSALGWHAEEAIEQATKRESEEIRRREERYRGNRPFPNLSGKVVVLVDDGAGDGRNNASGRARGAATSACAIDHRRAGRGGIELSRNAARSRRSRLCLYSRTVFWRRPVLRELQSDDR